MDLDAKQKSLKKVLEVPDQQFRIPPYQRPYAWTSEHVDDLWGDLLEDLGSGHFLGSIVVAAEDEDRPQVIDGQQRLTTMMLLLAVLRDEASRLGISKTVNLIERRFVADEYSDGDGSFKFRTGNANWPVFRDFVLRSPDDEKRKFLGDVGLLDKDLAARNRNLLDNFSRLQTHVETWLASHPVGVRSERVDELVKATLGVEFVVVEVGKLKDAFLLFETLNDRGLQLSAADLLRSHLLGAIASKAGEEDVEAAAAEWDAMLEDLGAEVDVTRFLRHYLLGTIPKVRKDGIYDQFKELVKTLGAMSVLAEIRIAAVHYGEFEAPDKVTHEPTRRVLRDLQTLRAMTCYIALIPARRYLSANDFLAYARLAEILTYRYSSVVGLGTNEIEPRYHEAAKLLIDSKGAALEQSRAVLISAMPDTEQFTVAFERLKMGRQYLLKYTLRRIEEHLSPAKEKELKLDATVHIEHVMPRTLSKEWKVFLGDDAEKHEDYVDRWGNLTLFFSSLNIPASNKTFGEKKTYYEDSQVELTKRLIDEDQWGLEQIETRQKWLARMADVVWACPSAAEPGIAKPMVEPALAGFERELDSMWPAVSALCVETSSEEIKQLADLLPGHLVQHAANHGQAATLAGRLEILLGEWEHLDAGERAVLRGAVSYFLEVNDAAPDFAVGGLVDDEAVVFAAESVLNRSRISHPTDAS